MMEWWSTGVMEYWSIGVLEYWSIGVGSDEDADEKRNNLAASC